MKRTVFGIPLRAVLLLGLAAVAGVAQACGVDVQSLFAGDSGAGLGMSAALLMSGEIDAAGIMKALDSVESKITKMSDKATEEIKNLGQVSKDTKTALDNLGTEQRALADRLLQLEQKGTAQQDNPAAEETVGLLVTKHANYQEFVKQDGRIKVHMDVKNTVTNAVGNTFSERRPNIIEGAFREFTLEALMTRIATSSGSVEWVRENVFTNGAAETTEGTVIPQTSITFTPGSMPVSTVAHWIKISRQLAMDNAALAAYINRRMVYGVDLKVENQLIAGNGASPNISGLTAAGNYVAHGYTAASLAAAGLANNRFDIIGKMIGDCATADIPAEVIILNTADWWTLRLAKDNTGRYLLGEPGANVVPMLFGLPVVASTAMPAGKVWVGALRQAVTLWYREGITLDLSDSDGDNFVNGLVTIRASRRVAQTVDKPAGCRYGDLVPA
jgi:HK97 family phage major capsid protein